MIGFTSIKERGPSRGNDSALQIARQVHAIPKSYHGDREMSAYRTQLYPGVRKVSLNKYQARVWVGVRKGGHLNLGIFDSEREAWIAYKEFFNGPALADFMQRGIMPPGVLPRHVREVAGGLYSAWTKKRGKTFFVGPYLFAEIAHERLQKAMRRVFRTEQPSGQPTGTRVTH